MNNPETDSELRPTAERLTELGRTVHINPRHKAQLHNELLRRHLALSTPGLMAKSQRGMRMTGAWFPGLKRLIQVAPVALAGTLAFSALLWALQISGHQAPQPAEAQRITQALAETVPTVTRWDVTVQRESSDSVSTYQCKYGPVQRLYVRDGQTYLYTSGTWYRVTANHSHAACSSDLQWAFTVLVNHLQQRDLVAQGKLVDGQPADQFRYVTPGGRDEQVVSTVWVNRHTGLIVRLQRVTLRGSHVVEREFADYRYDYQRSP